MFPGVVALEFCAPPGEGLPEEVRALCLGSGCLSSARPPELGGLGTPYMRPKTGIRARAPFCCCPGTFTSGLRSLVTAHLGLTHIPASRGREDDPPPQGSGKRLLRL